ncbi:hypothetical protein [Lacrimispora xylanisolvens]|uniref:hypothetical protein n=1 Tax=Lacrimispora xylanisolvens TaxID=384636 RepID=UPI003D9CA0A3
MSHFQFLVAIAGFASMIYGVNAIIPIRMVKPVEYLDTVILMVGMMVVRQNISGYLIQM